MVMSDSRLDMKASKLANGAEVRTARGEEIRTISAAALLGRVGVVRIEHEGELYTLRRTRLGRLILTK
jgi:hemin uptake protein HemP